MTISLWRTVFIYLFIFSGTPTPVNTRNNLNALRKTRSPKSLGSPTGFHSNGYFGGGTFYGGGRFAENLPEYRHEPPKTPPHILLHYSTFKVRIIEDRKDSVCLHMHGQKSSSRYAAMSALLDSEGRAFVRKDGICLRLQGAWRRNLFTFARLDVKQCVMLDSKAQAFVLIRVPYSGYRIYM